MMTNKYEVVMRVVSSSDYETVIPSNEHVGLWYDGQCNPQKLYLYIHSSEPAEDAEIFAREDIGNNSMPADVFHGKMLRLPMIYTVYTCKRAREIEAELVPLIQELLESYEERWNGNNYVGNWDEELVEKLEAALLEIEECGSDCEWDSQYEDEHES